MPISINPVFPVIAAQSAAPDVVLQPGTVIDARVVKLLDDNLVRIAIASLSIDVFSEVALQPGAALTLAVSQTPDGIRLAIVPPGDAGQPPATAVSAVTSATTSSPAISQATDISAIATGRAVGEPVPPTLTPVQALAVTAAAQAAAVKQAGLSPLFANATAAASSATLPPSLQQATVQLLAVRTGLTANLNGSDIKSAFQSSGLFLESSLASGSQAGQGSAPDLKAALLVFRQTLSTWLDQATPQTVTPATGAAPLQDATAQPRFAASPDAVPSLVPDIDVEEAYLPKALLPTAEEFLTSDGASQILSAAGQPLSAAARAAAATAALNVMQDVKGGLASGLIETMKTIVDGKIVAGPRAALQVGDEGVARTDAPPPPFRGAAPASQPVASSSIATDAAPLDAVRRLVDDADGAIARQTLLQIASLPDRAGVPGVRIDPAVPRWNFEIPFATPQGTAVAQFEISRDGGGKAVGAANRVWRARFSLNVEPTGPVHAIVSLSGETTSVRMWAERPETAMRLRDNAPELSRALRQAELEPGDIVIGDGAPPIPATTAPAGHFLDRAT
jgi:flagellar hook-length control protein FliK